MLDTACQITQMMNGARSGRDVRSIPSTCWIEKMPSGDKNEITYFFG